MIGYYYLHTNGDLIYKRDFDEDFRTSDFVRMFWRFDTENRADAWRVLVEGLALGASKSRVNELAAKWQCDSKDAEQYANNIGLILDKDGSAYFVHAKTFTNLQESPAGFGDTALEAFANFAKEVGFKASKMWGHTFQQLVAKLNTKEPVCDHTASTGAAEVTPWKRAYGPGAFGWWVSDGHGGIVSKSVTSEEHARAIAALPELVEATREVSADMRYLMGRASAEGHDAGQCLAEQTSLKLDAALAKMGGKL